LGRLPRLWGAPGVELERRWLPTRAATAACIPCVRLGTVIGAAGTCPIYRGPVASVLAIFERNPEARAVLGRALRPRHQCLRL
jgi:hypothetical protein